MNLDRSTGRVLRYGVFLAIAVMSIGVILQQFDVSVSDTIMTVGIGLLVLTPFFSIIASTIALYLEKDYKWMRVSLCVLLITAIGILVAFIF